LKPQSAKAKGRKLQQYVRDRILQHFPMLEEDDVKSTGMGQSGEDVQLSPKARVVLPWAVECKSRASFAVYKDYDQAEAHANKRPGTEPILVIKQNGDIPLAITSLDNLLQLYRMIRELQEDLNRGQ